MTLQRAVLIAAIAIPLHSCGASGSNAPSQSASPATQGARPDQGAVPDRLRSAIATTLKVDGSKIVPSASFTKDLGADELAIVELVMAYEREFKLDIRDADAQRFQRVQDVVDYLRQHGVTR